ncbi:atypical chemokine receptor 3 [Platysternon megacephalum]|uniref:Atypical chemokine receptor 3 n=1 Tax=Platysternon megacephalum TaxID=55544 RepID=A0A4D9E4Z7_9SAUR|nr:atypical chemokine receptor 3 [Platysternon megacephalum]
MDSAGRVVFGTWERQLRLFDSTLAVPQRTPQCICRCGTLPGRDLDEGHRSSKAFILVYPACRFREHAAVESLQKNQPRMRQAKPGCPILCGGCGRETELCSLWKLAFSPIFGGPGEGRAESGSRMRCKSPLAECLTEIYG